MRDLTSATAQIVAAQVATGSRTTAEILDLIRQVHATLASVDASPEAPGGSVSAALPVDEIDAAAPPAAAVEKPLKPAIEVEKSITHERLICLEDGAQVILLARHLKNKHAMTPEQYRLRWNLPRDYPMVAGAYAEQKRHMAIAGGLGQSVRPPARRVKALQSGPEKSPRRRLVPAGQRARQPELSIVEKREPELAD